MDVKAKVISSLRKHDTGDEFSYLSGFPKASVLIPLFLREGRVHVLLTVRSTEVSGSSFLSPLPSTALRPF